MFEKILQHVGEFMGDALHLLCKLGLLIYAGIIFIFNYSGVSGEGMTILGILMIADTAFGWMKVVAIGGKPTSIKLKSGAIGKVAAWFVPLVIALTLKASGMGGNMLLSSTLAILVWAEGYSVLQNIVSIILRKEIAEYDALTAVINGLRKVMKNQIETWLKTK